MPTNPAAAPAAPDHRRTWSDLIVAVEHGRDLETAQTAWIAERLLEGEVDPVQAAGLLVGLRTKGETAGEVRGFAEAMLSHAEPFRGPRRALDIVGTGGDRHNTVNISTMAAVVIAACGVPVVKHGNRASTSSTGSADALERLGLPLSVGTHLVEDALRQAGITFLFANVFHPGMGNIAPIRRALGAPTVFNFLGPLTNPGRVDSSVIGVFSPTMAPVMADVFASRGDHALVVHGAQGLDEFSLVGPNRVWEARDGRVVETVLDPADLPLPGTTLADLVGGTAAENAETIRRVLQGERGPVADTVALNAAAGLVAFDRSDDEEPLTARIVRALDRVRPVMDAAEPWGVMERWMDAYGEAQEG